MGLKTVILAACAVASFSIGAQAAEGNLKLFDVSGKVLLQGKSGLTAVANGQTVAPGTRVFLGKDAAARIANADGSCEASLPAGQVTVVDANTACNAVTVTPVAYEGVPGEIPPPVILIGFVAVIAAVSIYSLSEGDEPVSGP
jgi:hypothetical protein